MKEWISYKESKPSVSGFYEVKTTEVWKNVKEAYYSVHADAWVHDDGVWLPVDIRASVTHWR